MRSIDSDDAQAETVAQHFERVLEFVFAQQTGVDEDVGEAVTSGAMHQQGGKCGIDTAAEGADDAAVPYLRSNGFGGFLDESGATPLFFRFADAKQKIAKNFRAAIGVAHFGMKLDGVDFALG